MKRLLPVDGAQRRAALSSLALMVSSVVGGLLMFVFWVVAARSGGAVAVGHVSAQVATITFIGGAGGIGMNHVFARFLPNAGSGSAALIARCYLAPIALTIAAASIFLLTPWGRTSGEIMPPVVFTLLAVAACLFAIQDGALFGLGHVWVVPVENILTGVARLALIPLVAGLFVGVRSVLAAWGIVIVAAVLVTNIAIFTHFARKRVGEPELPERSVLVKFVAVEAATAVVSSAYVAFIPAVVTFSFGEELGGYFYVPWLIATLISSLLSAVLMSLVRETVAQPDAARDVMSGQSVIILLTVVGAMGSLIVFPHLILGILGNDFASESAVLLRWVGFALPATAIELVFGALCLIQRRPWPVFLARTLQVSATIVGFVMFSDEISDLGRTFFIVQWGVAILLIPVIITHLRNLDPSADLLPPQEAAEAGTIES